MPVAGQEHQRFGVLGEAVLQVAGDAPAGMQGRAVVAADL
jgi:hypothetical protein